MLTLAMIVTAVTSIWTDIGEAIKNAWNFIVNSGLAEDTVDAFGRIITYINDTLIPLMWDWINTIFGH